MKINSTVLLYFLSSIVTILLGIRIAMNFVLKGPFLVFYIVLDFVALYSIIGHGVKIYREFNKDQ